MEDSNARKCNGDAANHGLQLIRYPQYQNCCNSLLSWLDMRVFFVRITNFQVGDSTPESLALNFIPLDPDTLLEVNGYRSGVYSDGASSVLRRDRVDKDKEEATFVSTDNVRLTGSVKFEVFDKEDLVLSGVLEMSDRNVFTGESKNGVKRWGMNCEPVITAGTGFLKGKQVAGPEFRLPTIEVYIAGSFSGRPVILTKTLQLGCRKKQNRKVTLDSIPEYETSESQKDVPSEIDLQVADYRNLNPEEDYGSMYWSTKYVDGEDGELSWFNAGVRVGVGIGLGVCLGLGIGVGLLVRTYQKTTRNFRRRLF